MGHTLDASGQSTVEAAFLLPVALLLFAFLIQPVCVLYARSVMSSCASEVARLAVHATSDTEDLKAFALRRLKGIPNLAIFHMGGTDGWEISIDGAGSGTTVTVSIRQKLQLLPFLGSIVAAFGDAQNGVLNMTVEVSEDLRADWIEGTYADWVKIWE